MTIAGCLFAILLKIKKELSTFECFGISVSDFHIYDTRIPTMHTKKMTKCNFWFMVFAHNLVYTVTRSVECFSILLKKNFQHSLQPMAFWYAWVTHAMLIPWKFCPYFKFLYLLFNAFWELNKLKSVENSICNKVVKYLENCCTKTCAKLNRSGLHHENGRVHVVFYRSNDQKIEFHLNMNWFEWLWSFQMNDFQRNQWNALKIEFYHLMIRIILDIAGPKKYKSVFRNAL